MSRTHEQSVRERLARPPARGLFRALGLAFGIGLLGYLVWRLGPGEIAALLASVRWSLAVAVLLFCAHQSARAWALTACTPAGGRLAWRDALAIRFSSEAVQYLAFSGPVLAQPTETWLLTRRGLGVWEGLATTLAEYLVSALVAAAMAVASYGYVLGRLETSGAFRAAGTVIAGLMALFIALFIIGIGARLHIIGAVVRWVGRLPVVGPRVRPAIGGLPNAEDLLIGVLRSPSRLARIAGIECAAQLCLVLELAVLLRALQVGADPLTVAVLEGATKFVATASSIVPGQIGVAEGS